MVKSLNLVSLGLYLVSGLPSRGRDGFHRRLETHVHAVLQATSEGSDVACELAVLDLLPRTLYADRFELRHAWEGNATGAASPHAERRATRRAALLSFHSPCRYC